MARQNGVKAKILSLAQRFALGFWWAEVVRLQQELVKNREHLENAQRQIQALMEEMGLDPTKNYSLSESGEILEV